MPYPDHPFATISIKTSVSVKVLFANYIEMNQVKTAVEPDEPKTVERKIYRRERTRKLRTLNDGGKLEIVHVSAHNSSDFETMILRPMGRIGCEVRIRNVSINVGERGQRTYLSVKGVG